MGAADYRRVDPAKKNRDRHWRRSAGQRCKPGQPQNPFAGGLSLGRAGANLGARPGPDPPAIVERTRPAGKNSRLARSSRALLSAGRRAGEHGIAVGSSSCAAGHSPVSHGASGAPMKQALKARARALGFDDCRVTAAMPPEYAAQFKQWLAKREHGEMGYLERTAAQRVDPQKVLPGARSVIPLAASYAGKRRVSGVECVLQTRRVDGRPGATPNPQR